MTGANATRPKRKRCEDCRAEDDPERGLRQLATGRHVSELAGDDFEIAFEQGKIGARLIRNARMFRSVICTLGRRSSGVGSHPDGRGKGLATEAGDSRIRGSEAAKVVIADGFARVQMPFIQAIVEDSNALSRRVLEKLGMIYQRRVIFRKRVWMLYRLEPHPHARGASETNPIRTNC
jgi:RimJ/RimL family protein N-acetyltransferase